MLARIILLVLACYLVGHWFTTTTLFENDGFVFMGRPLGQPEEKPKEKPTEKPRERSYKQFHDQPVIHSDILRRSLAYDVLDIPLLSDDVVIKKAYRQQLRSHHPDKLKSKGKVNQDEENEKFAAVREAYRILTSKDRCMHDFRINSDLEQYEVCSDDWIMKAQGIEDEEEREKLHQNIQRKRNARRGKMETSRKEFERKMRDKKEDGKESSAASWVRSAIRESLAASWSFFKSIIRFVFHL
ncbi:hypothetical protein GGR53DRAFT_511943 [Hypoxylon sp. FL1150]|nr:hypothetical protein GGR53DRAFT_511943 [Hypoxylon sp. FL1150]